MDDVTPGFDGVKYSVKRPWVGHAKPGQKQGEPKTMTYNDSAMEKTYIYKL